MLTKDEILEAVAGAYCTENNSHKELDYDLVEAIANEIQKALLEKIKPDHVFAK